MDKRFVRSWPKTDICFCIAHVRFGGTVEMARLRLAGPNFAPIRASFRA
jgi:hypothetical protein